MSLQLPARFNKALSYYLSGPMTGYEDFNRPFFQRCTHYLRNAGLKIVSPHEVHAPDNLVGEDLWNHMMGLCHLEMNQTSGIIFLPGWVLSKGARQELQWGLELGHQFYFYDGVGQIVDMNRKDG